MTRSRSRSSRLRLSEFVLHHLHRLLIALSSSRSAGSSPGKDCLLGSRFRPSCVRRLQRRPPGLLALHSSLTNYVRIEIAAPLPMRWHFVGTSAPKTLPCFANRPFSVLPGPLLFRAICAAQFGHISPPSSTIGLGFAETHLAGSASSPLKASPALHAP